MPDRPILMAIPVTMPVDTVALLNSHSGSNGDLLFASKIINSMAPNRASPNVVKISKECHPYEFPPSVRTTMQLWQPWPSFVPHVKAHLRFTLRFSDEQKRQDCLMTASGKLSRKMLRQPNESTNSPPTTGPAAIPAPVTAAQMPSARARSAVSG